MIKVTLPNGIVVEGDSSSEVGEMIDYLHADPVAEEAEPELAVVTELPKHKADPSYPHKISDTKCGLKIGGREEQVLRAAKMIAEVNESRTTDFKSSEIAELLGTKGTGVTSALNGLAGKGLVAHGSHRNLWIVTRKGWDTKYWVTQPIRAGK
jgi:hypothetical protein